MSLNKTVYYSAKQCIVLSGSSRKIVNNFIDIEIKISFYWYIWPDDEIIEIIYTIELY